MPRNDLCPLADGVPVTVGADALAGLQRTLRALPADAQVFVLCDIGTRTHCWPVLCGRIPALADRPVCVVPAGEEHKQMVSAAAVWSFLAGHGADRQSVLLCLGGGMVTDLGGFAAACYMRGIRCIHVPTTLMGMVDAAIGGKAAIDHNGVKNLVGAFIRPLHVCADPVFLATLPERHRRNGMAEMLKHGLIADADHWAALRGVEQATTEEIAPLIARSAAIKAEVVTADPMENGPRKALNFGHTIGHAVEALALERDPEALLHGEAVIIGMVCATWISSKAGRFSRIDSHTVLQRLRDLHVPYPLTTSDDHALLTYMARDKKNRSGRFHFTLLTAMGRAEVDRPVEEGIVREALAAYRAWAERSPLFVM